MTVQRAASEPYTTSFETSVERVDGRDVWLNETYFYAASGGQPADRGRIGSDGEATGAMERRPKRWRGDQSDGEATG